MAIAPAKGQRNGSLPGPAVFTFPVVVTPQGDGSYLVRPGKPIQRETLRVAEVAQKLDVTVRHVIDLIEEGQLEAFNVGGSGRMFWRVSVGALAKFMRERSSLNV